MKKNYLFVRYPIYALLATLMLISSCSKEDMSPVMGDESPVGLKTAVEQSDPVSLQGYTRFSAYIVQEERWLFTGYDFNFLYCEADLSFPQNNAFNLDMEEFFVMGEDLIPVRASSLDGHISSSGQLKYTWEGVLAEMEAHTGITLHGPGVNEGSVKYKGYYDGQVLNAEMHLIGQQTQPALYEIWMKDPGNPEILFEGPIKVVFMVQLEVVE